VSGPVQLPDYRLHVRESMLADEAFMYPRVSVFAWPLYRIDQQNFNGSLAGFEFEA
jgi:hypothetical protein